MKKRGGGGRLLLTRNPFGVRELAPVFPSSTARSVRPLSNHGLAGGGGGLTGVPDPSLSACMESTGKVSNRSANPLGQRTCTHPVFVTDPRPKRTPVFLFETALDPLRTSATRLRAP